MILNLIKTFFRSLRFYVIADPDDNSVTLSKHLFRHIRDNAEDGGAASVFVFLIPETGLIGFMLNPGIEKETQMCDIQYNEKYKCIGFETLCPSVGNIFYRYGLPADGRVKLSVSVKKSAIGQTYYILEKPNGKHLR